MSETQTIQSKRDDFPYGFHLSREVWVDLGLLSFLSSSPDAIQSGESIRQARELAARANDHPEYRAPEERPLHAGEVLAYGLLSDILRYLVHQYCAVANPGVVGRAMDNADMPPEVLEAKKAILVFLDELPPKTVLSNVLAKEEYLSQGEAPFPNRDRVTMELALLHLAMGNPATQAFHLLHDDKALDNAKYRKLVAWLENALELESPFPGKGISLLKLLRAPIEASPHSLEGQLAFVLREWRTILPALLLERLERVQDVFNEETKMRGFGSGPMQTPDFGPDTPGYEEVEAFSQDKAWMPNLVLLAKSTYVWLDQLSKKYGKEIIKLSDVPDEELDRLAQWGFSGLWLIGLWERSESSKIIKRRMGNPEAEASAYSLYDYNIAHDLGGDDAYRDLSARAWKRGIRLASDMVPNHFGIYSRWVVEHPDWFVQCAYPPFPSYRFTGPDVSPDDRIELQLEDGYWNHSDAAVVFKWRNKISNETRYIYHGNDGTNMPWNDTAQLNFLIAEVREAITQTILHVARMFPIIRFDAAMTLAKQHYQRLWFPAPGKGGDIPSRAEHGLSRMQFEQLFPVEFWREVVDRVAAEAPDTLLLAEAFWLMEGYFVRTLGMHRVYNSAFMNMLKMEENSKYRQTIKNVMEFSPEILQRFVNFMNNPDEDSAEAQFGKSDKYFGVATLMATLPGLPMFGHGQVEGFGEKYGMEYRRAYWNESVDTGLVQRHEAQIFPLLRQRHIFSGSHNFALYDFEHSDGWVDENVFAYANRSGGERALVVYNNAYNRTRGSIRISTAINKGGAHAPHLIRFSLGEGLALNQDERCYYIYKEQNNGLEYLKHGQGIAQNGLYFELSEYQCMVFLDWHEIIDNDLSWARLCTQLQGRGVESVWEAYQELNLHKVLEPLEFALRPKNLDAFFTNTAIQKNIDNAFLALNTFYAAVAEHVRSQADVDVLITKLQTDHAEIVSEKSSIFEGVGHCNAEALRRILILWHLFHKLGALTEANETNAEAQSAKWMREWYLTKHIAQALHQWGLSLAQAWQEARMVRIIMAHRILLPRLQRQSWGPLLAAVLHDGDALAYLGMNAWQGRYWLNKEAWETLWRILLFALERESHANGQVQDEVLFARDDVKILLEAAADVGYDRDAILDTVK